MSKIILNKEVFPYDPYRPLVDQDGGGWCCPGGVVLSKEEVLKGGVGGVQGRWWCRGGGVCSERWCCPEKMMFLFLLFVTHIDGQQLNE